MKKKKYSTVLSFIAGVIYGINNLNWPFPVLLVFYAGGCNEGARCLGPLLRTVINKYVQLHIQQVLSPAALSRQSEIGHTCIIVIHAQSESGLYNAKLDTQD